MLHHSAVTHSTPVIERQVPFSPLPLEVRRMIYRFAVVEPEPLTLISHLDDRGVEINGYGVDKDLRMLDTCREFREQMKEMLYSQNCFSYTVGTRDDNGQDSYKVHFKLIQKLYVAVADLEAWCEELQSEATIDEIFEFQTALVMEFPSKDYRLKYLLVECEPQHPDGLARYLHPLSLLRNISAVHFRSRDASIHPFFRSMEGLMMSNRLVPHTDLYEYFDRLLYNLHDTWFEESLETESIVLDQDEEQMEAAARKLYSLLDLGRDFVPQSGLNKHCFREI